MQNLAIKYKKTKFIYNKIMLISMALSLIPLELAFSAPINEARNNKDQKIALETIQVTLDNAKLLKLPTGTETIVVGNPTFADVVVQKNGIMVLTGRAIGSTNFIALDNAGVIISESIVSVTSNSLPGRLVVQRGSERETYECQPQCLPTISLGDDNKRFGLVIGQTGQRDNAASQPGAAGGSKK